MVELRALVAAAGRGRRAGLPYPKTLYPVRGTPILLRIVTLLSAYDSTPTIIVSPEGKRPILDCLAGAGAKAHLVVQSEPAGMGDAVLRFAESPVYDEADHILLVWGDIPFMQAQTVDAVVRAHKLHQNDFTFATRMVPSAYTVVTRDATGHVIGVAETRERSEERPGPGERDIGLFVFRKDVTLALLQEDLPGKFGRVTGEHGFLYVVEHLVRRRFQVEALPIATEDDLISLNRLSDIGEG
jgi:bifunctional UDP-N-acetylglucosamine pyrophosphorylase/glucosamine-1-phosphate N-acetyltransferase